MAAETVVVIKNTQVITADVAADMLYRFLTQEESRRKYALHSREAMHVAVKAGQAPEGHRAEFVVSVSNAVLEVLLDASEQYKLLYPYDTVILGDFLDILATTRGRVLKAAKASATGAIQESGDETP